MSDNIKIGLSACLLGIKCNYKGKDSLNKEALKLFRENYGICVCPEIIGGLSTPRVACEIQGGDGCDVLDGKTKVMGKDGKDYTKEFVKGAKKAVNLLKKNNVRNIYLKANSPSCGVKKIHDGSFSNKFIKGFGVFSAQLKKEKINITELL